jgi:hypothetical protein
MRAGDLVRTTRAQIGVPAGAIGLIIKSHEPPRRLSRLSIWVQTSTKFNSIALNLGAPIVGF